MNKVAPQDMRQHLMLNQSRLSTAEEVAQEIEDYCDATEEFSRDDKGQAGLIAPVGKGLVKGGKLNGVPYNFGNISPHVVSVPQYRRRSMCSVAVFAQGFTS